MDKENKSNLKEDKIYFKQYYVYSLILNNMGFYCAGPFICRYILIVNTIVFTERQCCESAALNMSANLENSAVATGLEKVSFHSNPKERQCQRMLKLLHNCTHLTY